MEPSFVCVLKIANISKKELPQKENCIKISIHTFKGISAKFPGKEIRENYFIGKSVLDKRKLIG